jgi:flagellin-like protein
MRIINQKKGQSNVLVVVLIIMIVLVLVVIVWNVVVPMIRERGEEVELGAIITNLEVEEIVLFPTGASKVTVKRGSSDIPIDKLDFVFSDENKSNYVIEEENVLKPLETITYSFSPIVEIGKIEKVGVIPVFGETLGIESSSGEIYETQIGLMDWWRFDDGKDFVDDDDCQLFNIEEKDERTTAKFDGQEISCGDVGNYSEMSVGFWINTLDDDATIIEKGNCKIKLENSRISFDLADSMISDRPINKGNWSYVVVTSNRIYIDGNLAAFRNSKPGSCNGRSIIGRNFVGNLDELMFFNKSLFIHEADYLFKNRRV